ncbi:MAG: efflux RND transporter periplasmic adaptor subunit [Bacillota bacterium]
MKKKKIWIIAGVVSAIVIIMILASGSKGEEADTFQVKKGNLEEYVEETGVVKTDDDMTIFAQTAGKVTKMVKEPGEEVKAGDVLLEMDAKEAALQRRELEAQKEGMIAQYKEAVKPASQEEINKLHGMVNAAKTAYEEAKRAADSSKQLYEQGAISYDEYKKAQANLVAEESSLNAAQMDLAAAKKGGSEYLRSQYEAQIQQIQVQIDRLNTQMEDLKVKAPMDGTVLAKLVEQESYVQPGTALMEIGNPQKMYIQSEVLIGDIGKIKEGLKVVIENEDLGIKSLIGKVRKIHPKAFSKVSDLGIEQKRVLVEVDLQGNTSQLKPGYDADIRFITKSKEQVLLVDERAVFDYEGKEHVFVVEKGKAVLRSIEKGIESGDYVEVLKGLDEGEEVILSPDNKISEGTKIIKSEDKK